MDEPSRPRLAVVGLSGSETCGVRDHAVRLAEALDREGVRCSVHWLRHGERAPPATHGERSPPATRAAPSLPALHGEVSAWAGRLAGELDRLRPQAVLLHYSVFAYSYRGLPLLLPPVLAAARRSGAPLISFVHEAAYPWGIGGPRGWVWALAHRALLTRLVRASAALLVTADRRAEWFATRRWLARRPIRVAPVFSNLPAPDPAARPPAGARTIGVFGYSYEGVAVQTTLAALAALHGRGLPARLALLGAPGPASPSGRAWVAAADELGVTGPLSFSGRLPAQRLADALAACDVLLLPDASGPSSRKGTLAASLMSGRPVVAIDGPWRWAELVRARALSLAPDEGEALADALQALLCDERERERLGARGRAFAERAMSVERTAALVRGLLSVHAHGRERQLERAAS